MNQPETIKNIIEGILFAAGDAVTIERLQTVLEEDRDTILQCLTALSNEYDFAGRGLMLARMDNKVQLCSRPAYALYIRKATENRRPPSLSSAALEVLSIIAYRQPTTRAFIEQLRGVDSSNTVTMLADKGLVEECGKLDVPGRPTLFRTTTAFLRTFSIAALDELPLLPELAGTQDEQLSMDMEQAHGASAEGLIGTAAPKEELPS